MRQTSAPVVAPQWTPILGDGPLESRAQALADLGDEVLPTGVAVLTRERELGVAQRYRSISRELLGLFAEGF